MLTRSAPMKRTPFKAKTPEQREAKQVQYVARPREVATASVALPMRAQAPKREYVRSRPLMKAYRAIACQLCFAEDGTVCGAHSNWLCHGKAKGKKADDNRCASLCSRCHFDIDQGAKLTKTERFELWWEAHVRTVYALKALGRWPASVPVPEFGPWTISMLMEVKG